MKDYIICSITHPPVHDHTAPGHATSSNRD